MHWQLRKEFMLLAGTTFRLQFPNGTSEAIKVDRNGTFQTSATDAKTFPLGIYAQRIENESYSPHLVPA